MKRNLAIAVILLLGCLTTVASTQTNDSYFANQETTAHTSLGTTTLIVVTDGGSGLSDRQFALAIIAILVPVFLFYFEYRKGRQERAYREYLNTANNFIQGALVAAENDALLGLYDYDPVYKALSKEEKKLCHYCNALIMTFEIVWECHQRGYFQTGVFFRKDDGTW